MANAFEKGTLNVRMYNVGFGDCFLLSFPVGDGHRHVLVDCGAHPKGTLGNLEQIAKHVAGVTGNELAILVATHRHQDHIWGFERGEKTFRQMKIGQVWLPWVEEPGNRAAGAMWKNHAAARAALEARLARASPGARTSAAAAVLANLKPNEEALTALRTHFGAASPDVRYLFADHADLVSPAGIQGLVVKSLGPPKEEKFLKKMNPPQAERWGLAAEGGANGAERSVAPFDSRRAPDGSYWSREETGVFSDQERKRFRDHMSDALDLAFALEDAVNNTSLSLLFLFRGQGLLMPGDAQWGNWSYWLGEQVAPELLEQVTLYKVGHHGSHNATPRSLIEKLPQRSAVMVPTQHDGPFPTIPEPKLIAALTARSGGRIVASDAVPKRLPRGFARGDFWTDYRVAVG
jgi:beta-lactamase superfamily II metal-dependent hydrolase